MNIFIRKSDFYEDDTTPYKYENLLENYLADINIDNNSNYENDPLFIELVEKLIKLEELFKERCQHVLDVREEKDKLIEEKDILIRNKDQQIEDLKKTIEILLKEKKEKE